VRFLRNPANIGASRNYNRVLELARGEFFKWAAHDDVHLPGFLTRCVQVLEQAPPSVVLVAPRTEVIDETGQRIKENWRVETLDTRRRRPHQRVADVLRQVAWATAQFGLFRTQPLRLTRGIDAFFASDQVLLLELAILGEIWEIPEVLFQRRFHAGISTNVNKTQAEFNQWFDPKAKAKRRMLPRLKLELEPRWKLAYEFSRSISRLPLSPLDRSLCHATALGIWTARESRRLGNEYWSRVRDRLRGTRRG
jgi:glycosyltransferase involved in cell wall biosynthesis